MDTLLLVLGLAGGCAIVVSVLVSSSNSRNYSANTSAGHVSRSGSDRRSGVVVTFPLQINDLLIHEDRRSGMDRRFATA